MRWTLRLFLLLLAVVVVAPAALFLASLQAEPAVRRDRGVTSADAVRARTILRDLRRIVRQDGGRSQLRLRAGELDASLAFVTRAVPRLRGRVAVRPDEITSTLSLDAKVAGIGGWFNVVVGVLPSDSGLRLSRVRAGPFDIPPSLALGAGRISMNLVLGEQAGDRALRALERVAVAGDTVVVGIHGRPGDRDAIRDAASAARQLIGISDENRVRAAYLAMDRAASSGQLGQGGSLLPYLRYVLEAAAADPDPEEALKAAVYALAILCGHRKFEQVVGDVVPSGTRVGRHCEPRTLAGRTDLRQHFVLSAALEIASDSGAAFAIGEYKELLDSRRGGSGFSFDDIAADRAGIRFGRAVTSAPVEELPALAAALSSESAVMPRVSDLPSRMSEANFRRRFGAVDSPAYGDMLTRIDRRIARLPLYAGR